MVAIVYFMCIADAEYCHNFANLLEFYSIACLLMFLVIILPFENYGVNLGNLHNKLRSKHQKLRLFDIFKESEIKAKKT